MWLVKLSIQRPILMIMVELFIIVLGIIGYSKIGVDLYPEINPPVITVTTQYPGADPEQIETLVSKVIEEEVNQIGGIEKLTSTTRENISQVIIEFELEIDVKDAVADVRSKVSRAKAKLPREVEEPLIQRLDFSDRPIIQLAVIPKDKSSHLTSAEIRKFAEDKVKPKLQKIDGVGQINVFGGAEREIFVELDRRKLLLWNETPTSVANSIKQANLNIPAGSIKEEPKNRGLRILGEYKKVSEIGDTIIKTLSGGKVLRVSDLGLVRDDLKDRESIARVNGQEVVLLEVKKQSGSNTVAVADEVKKFAGKLKDSASSAYFVELIYDGARKIHMSLNDVIESLVIAAILAVIVVYLFLGSMQSTLITGLALPTTIIASFFVLNLTGFTLNIMTLLGLTLCVGLVLDDAIVVRENIWKKN